MKLSGVRSPSCSIPGLVWLLGSYVLAQQLWRLIALLVLAKPQLKRSEELLPSRLSRSVAGERGCLHVITPYCTY